MSPMEDSFEQELAAFLPIAPRQEWFHQVRETMDREYMEHGFSPSPAFQLLPSIGDGSLVEQNDGRHRHDRRWMAAAAALMLAGPLMVIKMQPQGSAASQAGAKPEITAASMPVSEGNHLVLPASTGAGSSTIQQEVSPAQDRGLVLHEGRPCREYVRQTMEIHQVIQPGTGRVILVKKPMTEIFHVPVGN